MKSLLVLLASLVALSATAAYSNDGECQIVDSPNNRLSYYYAHNRGFVFNELVKKGYSIVNEQKASENAIRITDMMVSYTEGQSPVNKVQVYFEITLPDYRIFSGSYTKRTPWFGKMNAEKGLKEVIAELPDCNDL